MHGDLSNVDPATFGPCDAILCAGDLTEFGLRADLHVIDFVKDWLTRCGRTAPTFWIPGNHDALIKEHSFGEIDGVECILDRTVEIDGYTIHGVSMSPAYAAPQLASEYDYMTCTDSVEREAYTFEPVDIVLSHAPPYGVMDRWDGRSHVGSSYLLSYIHAAAPLLVVCGHAHGETGIETVRTTKVVNVAETVLAIEI